ncbi:OmpP1/FadL family transporter [Salinimicrobium oceani]|uniref:Transporter n=1 Tax=Salinimicrobium oceani TaxID=2722702 RepID=A0ABX1D365_9FLAO|nr:outer membrane protein transport protein [Salinimicrobium oceani]NJW53777.1 transporter [Salinimicrobium oceani]
MKKLIFAFTAILGMTVEAQNITDAVRYSSTDLNGTARYRAMSGAFGALGGDLSSLDVNPAGSAVFLSSSATFTLNFENTENEVSFKNGFGSNSHGNFDLGQGGAVFVFNSNDDNADWKKFALAFNYTKTATFEDDYLANGTNSRSISEYFLSYAQGIALDYLVPVQGESQADLYSYLGETPGLGFGAQQAFLGLQGGVIQVNNPNNIPESDPGYYDLNSYSSALTPGSYDQKYFYSATGLNGKFSFNFASQYQDFLYLGLNLNTHFLNYERLTSLDEGNFNASNEFVYFEDRLTTLGSGFSFQLGALARAGENLRIGAAFESPTWYTISEETSQFIESDIAVVNPNVVNIYPDYKLQTPAKYTGSLAYLFGASALLSFDYSYKDYSTTQFKPKDEPAFITQNNIISEELKGASVFRLGGEYRIQGWSLRGGYRFEESPYRNESTVGDLTGYSAGLGYNFGNIKIDLAYNGYERELNPQLYQTGLTDTMNIQKRNSDVLLSISFGL